MNLLQSDKNNIFVINIFINDRALLNITLKSKNNGNDVSFSDFFSFNCVIGGNKYFLMCNNVYDILILIDKNIENKNNVKLIEKRMNLSFN